VDGYRDNGPTGLRAPAAGTESDLAPARVAKPAWRDRLNAAALFHERTLFRQKNRLPIPERQKKRDVSRVRQKVHCQGDLVWMRGESSREKPGPEFRRSTGADPTLLQRATGPAARRADTRVAVGGHGGHPRVTVARSAATLKGSKTARSTRGFGPLQGLKSNAADSVGCHPRLPTSKPSGLHGGLQETERCTLATGASANCRDWIRRLPGEARAACISPANLEVQLQRHRSLQSGKAHVCAPCSHGFTMGVAQTRAARPARTVARIQT
jgi:hypothetical protein